VPSGGGGELALHPVQAILHLAHHLQSARGAAAQATQEKSPGHGERSNLNDVETQSNG
jgi:hypothetical protein